jgi:hypothetical protein
MDVESQNRILLARSFEACDLGLKLKLRLGRLSGLLGHFLL